MATPIQIAFVMDQQVGLQTQSLYFEQFVAEDATIAPLWVPVRYQKDAGILTRIPILPNGIKGTLRGVAEIRETLHGKKWDVALWATWAAKSVPELVSCAPSSVRMDMTPNQMEAMGAQYGYSKRRAQFLGGFKRRATQRLYDQAAHFFPWNDWTAQSLKSDWNVPDSKITVVSPGVDTARYCPDSMKKTDGITRILFVGGDFQRKGGDLLLDWMNTAGAALQKRYPFELHFVTRDTPAATDVKKGLFFHHGITNNSPELVRLYQGADLFVLPTRADCYSLVALEAMACGLPVVITGLGGIPEIVTQETGFLLDDADETKRVTQIHSILEELITNADNRKKRGDAARLRAVTDFDARHSVQKVLLGLKATI